MVIVPGKHYVRITNIFPFLGEHTIMSEFFHGTEEKILEEGVGKRDGGKNQERKPIKEFLSPEDDSALLLCRHV